MSVMTRPFGSSGEPVSILGVGGGHIGSPRLSTREAVHLVQYAVDCGITFMDNAWEYNQGRSEAVMGEALQGRRDQVFLMTKVCARDRAGAERDLNQQTKTRWALDYYVAKLARAPARKAPTGKTPSAGTPSRKSPVAKGGKAPARKAATVKPAARKAAATKAARGTKAGPARRRAR